MAATVTVTRKPSSAGAANTTAEHFKHRDYWSHFSNNALNLAQVRLLCIHKLSSRAGLLLLATEMRHKNLRPSGRPGEAYEAADNNPRESEITIHWFPPAGATQSQSLPDQMQQGSASTSGRALPETWHPTLPLLPLQSLGGAGQAPTGRRLQMLMPYC